MFTRNDLISFLSDLEMAEANMRDLYSESVNSITNKKILLLFKKLKEAEERHYGLVTNLRKLIIKKSVDGS